MKEFYVYVHIRKSSGTVFYVGKGKGDRVNSRSGRSAHWRSTADKHGIIRKIIMETDAEDEAYLFEAKVIKILRWIGCNLVNIANGGEGGLSGCTLSDDHKEKLRNAKLGKKQSKEHATKSALAKKGKKQPIEAVEKVAAKKRKLVVRSDGVIFNSVAEAARKTSIELGVNVSQGNISACCLGKRNNTCGFSWSYDVLTKPDFKPTKFNIKKVSNGSVVFDSVQDAVNWVLEWRTKANHQTISSCARGELQTAYGYKWRYV